MNAALAILLKEHACSIRSLAQITLATKLHDRIKSEFALPPLLFDAPYIGIAQLH